MMLGGAITNALAFLESNFLFSHLSSSAERKQHNVAVEKLQHERDLWNEQRLERIGYINQKLKNQGHAENTFKDVNEAMQQYYLLTGEHLSGMPPEPQLPDFLVEDQQSEKEAGELVIVGFELLFTGYLSYGPFHGYVCDQNLRIFHF